MLRRTLFSLAASLVGLTVIAGADATATPAEAAGASKAREAKAKGKAIRYRSSRPRPQVRGYLARRGGYSFTAIDTVNTTVGSRSLYGGTNVYRDRQLDSQTIGGPFDHGFFFNSPIGPRGGDSPYHQ